jgi:hypothetical protein
VRRVEIAQRGLEEGRSAFLKRGREEPAGGMVELWLRRYLTRLPRDEDRQLYVFAFTESYGAAAEGRRAHTQKESS